MFIYILCTIYTYYTQLHIIYMIIYIYIYNYIYTYVFTIDPSWAIYKPTYLAWAKWILVAGDISITLKTARQVPSGRGKSGEVSHLVRPMRLGGAWEFLFLWLGYQTLCGWSKIVFYQKKRWVFWDILAPWVDDWKELLGKIKMWKKIDGYRPHFGQDASILTTMGVSLSRACFPTCWSMRPNPSSNPYFWWLNPVKIPKKHILLISSVNLEASFMESPWFLWWNHRPLPVTSHTSHPFPALRGAAQPLETMVIYGKDFAQARCFLRTGMIFWDF